MSDELGMKEKEALSADVEEATEQAEQVAEEIMEQGTEQESTVQGSSKEEGTEGQFFAELEAKLLAKEKEAEENYQKYLRAQADFDNLRRRTRKEQEERAKYASLPLVEQMLPVIDNFERALAASQDTQNVETLAKGVEMVFRQLEDTLQAEGLEVIPTVGTVFDPHVHQAVMMVDSEEYESGMVVEEIQKGYKLKDKVIRPAMVKVCS